jgi:hypothetical protein
MFCTSIRRSCHARSFAPLMTLSLLSALAVPLQAGAQARRTITPQPIFRNGNNTGQGGNLNYRPQPIFRNGNNNTGQGGNLNYRPQPIFRNGNTGGGTGFGGTGRGTGLGGNGFGGTGGGKANFGRGGNTSLGQGSNVKPLQR